MGGRVRLGALITDRRAGGGRSCAVTGKEMIR